MQYIISFHMNLTTKLVICSEERIDNANRVAETEINMTKRRGLFLIYLLF